MSATLELFDSLAAAGGSAARATGSGLPSAVDVDAWLGLLDGPADPSAGERVFFHPKGPGCYRCHQVNGRGGRAGPDLSILAAAWTGDGCWNRSSRPARRSPLSSLPGAWPGPTELCSRAFCLSRRPTAHSSSPMPRPAGMLKLDEICRTQTANDFDHA